VATLRINFRGLKEEFTTENRDRPSERIDMKLVSGPFRSLEGSWRFTPLSEKACKVELNLRYELSSVLINKVVGAVFDEIANSLVDAFARQADLRFGGS
jgi:ribosome-associated toxin RatA of RatAB toxin-antitoxin module